MRPRVLTISPYAAGDANLIALSQQPSALVALTLTSTPVVLDTPRTVLLTFADGPIDAAIAEDGGVFTDETTEANEGTADDMTLMPAVPAAGIDRYNFGADNPFGRLDLNVSTGGTGTYTLVWEYFNGVAWAPLTGVVDGTTNFKTAGLESVTFTIPDDWAPTTINAQGPFFFIRAEIQAGTVTAVPLGEQAFLGGLGAGNRFLITGEDAKGNELVESVVGVAAGSTAESSRSFAQVDEVLPESSGDGLVEVGTTTVVPTNWLPLDYLQKDFRMGLALNIPAGTLTPDFTVELTETNLLDYQGNNPVPGRGQHVGSVFDRTLGFITPFDHDTLANVAAIGVASGNIAFPVRAVRLLSNTVFTVNSVALEVTQAHHGP